MLKNIIYASILLIIILFLLYYFKLFIILKILTLCIVGLILFILPVVLGDIIRKSSSYLWKKLKQFFKKIS
jgi:hypothetical protein